MELGPGIWDCGDPISAVRGEAQGFSAEPLGVKDRRLLQFPKEAVWRGT